MPGSEGIRLSRFNGRVKFRATQDADQEIGWRALETSVAIDQSDLRQANGTFSTHRGLASSLPGLLLVIEIFRMHTIGQFEILVSERPSLEVTVPGPLGSNTSGTVRPPCPAVKQS